MTTEYDWKLVSDAKPTEGVEVLTAIPCYNDPANGFTYAVLVLGECWYEPDDVPSVAWGGYPPMFWKYIQPPVLP